MYSEISIIKLDSYLNPIRNICKPDAYIIQCWKVNLGIYLIPLQISLIQLDAFLLGFFRYVFNFITDICNSVTNMCNSSTDTTKCFGIELNSSRDICDSNKDIYDYLYISTPGLNINLA